MRKICCCNRRGPTRRLSVRVIQTLWLGGPRGRTCIPTYREKFRIIGDPPSKEVMLSMYASGNEGMQEFTISLESGVRDPQDGTGVRQYVAENFEAPGGEHAIEEAFAIYPAVYCCHRVARNYNSGRAAVNIAHGDQRIKPFLNTWVNVAGQKAGYRKAQIPVEFYNLNASGGGESVTHWNRAAEFSNLNLPGDGTVVEFSGCVRTDVLIKPFIPDMPMVRTMKPAWAGKATTCRRCRSASRRR